MMSTKSGYRTADVSVNVPKVVVKAWFTTGCRMKSNQHYAKAILFVAAITIFSATQAWAVNGVNFIGIGPISRSMGGVGIASPQDTVSSIFSNPATMSFAPFSGKTQFDIGATLLIPQNDSAKVTNNGDSVTAEVNDKQYLAPAVGVSMPISIGEYPLQFGLGLAGTTGLGMDYKGTALDNSTYFPVAPGVSYPLISGSYTQLGVLKVAPSVSTKLTDSLAVGFAMHIDQISLDLGAGGSSAYTWGGQAGIVYKITDNITTGLTYMTPQSVNLKRIADLDGDGKKDDIDLGIPQQAGFGLSYAALDNKLLLEANVKWINWANADAWKEFDWKNQLVYAIGAQYKATPGLSLRCGYNYAENQIKKHNNFNGAAGNTTNVQGKAVPTYYYETLRSIGIPAIFEHHISAGFGYQLSEHLGVNVGYTHEFGSSFSESGTNLYGQTSVIDNKMFNDAFDLGLSWSF